MFKTSKCSHGDKGMCINCMINKNKHEKNSTEGTPKNAKLQCNHPPHMKCIRCITLEQTKDQCQHPDYQICKKCEHLLRYQKFSYFLQTLQNQCTHKKPCSKCVPALSRKNYFIDKTCKKHLPYPQALCDACMAPTLTVCKQKYAHVSRMVIRTTSIYRIIQAKVFGILLGKIMDDIVYVQDVYFPKQQLQGSQYINPQSIEDNSCIFEMLGLQQVGLLYNSQQITGMSLMLSALFQQKYLAIEQGHQISKFITMRLHLSLQENNQPHFQCYMISDQLQAFNKNNIIYEKESMDKHFDLITAKSDRLSQLPTFLREGVETDKLFFKEVIVWIPTIAQENFKSQNQQNGYPFYGLENQDVQTLKKYIHQKGEPFEKYGNIQFLLHLKQQVGRSVVATFMNYAFQDHPDNFLLDICYELERKQASKLKKMQSSFK